MIYKIQDYDYVTKAWVDAVRFKSSVSRINKGYLLRDTKLYYPYVAKGSPVAPSCLAKWID